MQRELAALLRAPLEVQGLTHQQLARLVGHERSAVSHVLSGRRGSRELIEHVAGVLGADPVEARRLHEQIATLRRRIRQARRLGRPLQGSPPQHVHSHDDLIAALVLLLERSRTSRREVARRSGWSPAAVSAVLRGERGLSRRMMWDIVRACGVEDDVARLWLDRWRDVGWPDLQERHQRRWRGYQRRWYAERAGA